MTTRLVDRVRNVLSAESWRADISLGDFIKIYNRGI